MDSHGEQPPPKLKVWACGLAFAGKPFSARGSIHYQPKMGNVSFGRGIVRRYGWAWVGGTEYSVQMERGNTPKLRGGPWICNAPVFERGISGLAPDWPKADSVALDRKIKGPRAGICTALPTTPYRSRSCTTTKQGRPKFGKTYDPALESFLFHMWYGSPCGGMRAIGTVPVSK